MVCYSLGFLSVTVAVAVAVAGFTIDVNWNSPELIRGVWVYKGTNKFGPTVHYTKVGFNPQTANFLELEVIIQNPPLDERMENNWISNEGVITQKDTDKQCYDIKHGDKLIKMYSISSENPKKKRVILDNLNEGILKFKVEHNINQIILRETLPELGESPITNTTIWYAVETIGKSEVQLKFGSISIRVESHVVNVAFNPMVQNP